MATLDAKVCSPGLRTLSDLLPQPQCSDPGTAAFFGRFPDDYSGMSFLEAISVGSDEAGIIDARKWAYDLALRFGYSADKA